MEAAGDDPFVGTMAWMWVLECISKPDDKVDKRSRGSSEVIFAATVAGLRFFVSFVSADSLPSLPGNLDNHIETMIKEGLAEAIEQEDTMVMRAMYVATIACLAVQFGGIRLAPGYAWKLRCACLTFLTWRAAAVVVCILTSLMDALLLDKPEGERRKKSFRLEKRKSMVAGKLAEHRAHELVCNFLTVIVYAVAGVFVFDNLGIEVGGIVSYMGCLGLALSLGAQYMLQDLLGYAALMIDASIVVGDTVTVGSDRKGSVEAINYLSTKVRTLEGDLYIYRNRDFATTRIVNGSRQPHRLVTVHFELAASTSPGDMQVARECAQQALEELAASTSTVAEGLGDSVRWADHGTRFYAVFITNLAEGSFQGIGCDMYFYMDGTASKGLENEAKTLVYIRLAKLLEDRGIRTQGDAAQRAVATAMAR